MKIFLYESSALVIFMCSSLAKCNAQDNLDFQQLIKPVDSFIQVGRMEKERQLELSFSVVKKFKNN